MDDAKTLAAEAKALHRRRSAIVCGINTAAACNRIDAACDTAIDALADLAASHQAEVERLSLYKNLAEEYGLSVFSEHAQIIATLRAEVERLTDDRDSWCAQASARTEDAVRFAAERDAGRAEVERLNLLVMQGAEGRAEAAHAERYYRQAEALLTKNERALHAELAALKAAQDDQARDAARYRKLRWQDWFASPLAVVVNPKDCVKPGSDCPSRDRLDAMIDAIEETP